MTREEALRDAALAFKHRHAELADAQSQYDEDFQNSLDLAQDGTELLEFCFNVWLLEQRLAKKHEIDNYRLRWQDARTWMYDAARAYSAELEGE
jgi:hypothetical protein